MTRKRVRKRKIKNEPKEVQLFSSIKEPSYDLIEQIPGKKRNTRKISFGRVGEDRIKEVMNYDYVSVPQTKEQIEEEEDSDSTKKPAANEPVLWNTPKVRKDIPGIA